MAVKNSIEFIETFHLREPVLKAMSTIKYEVVKHTDTVWSLDLDYPVDRFSPHQQDAIHFALNWSTGLGKGLNGLDPAPAKAFAEALAAVYINGNGRWE